MSDNKEKIVNTKNNINKSVLKAKNKVNIGKCKSSSYHFLPLPDYKAVILEANKEKPVSAELIKETKKASVNKKWFNLAFFLVNIFIVVGIFVFQFSTGEAASLTELFSLKPYYRFLFLGLGVFFLINILDALKFHNLIRRATGYCRPWISYKTVALGRYYDCITPMSTGGQPFQMLYLKKNSVKGDAATAIPLAKYFLWQIAWIVLICYFLIFNTHYYLNNNGYIVQIFAWVSLVLNFCLISGVILLSISKKVGPRFVLSILKLLHKIHLVKDYRATFKKTIKFVREYQRSFKSLITNPFQFGWHIFLNAVTILLNASLAYCVYLAFNIDGGISYLEIVTNVMVCDLAIGLVPLPGASGAAEISFAAVFARYFPSSTLVWAMLFWRIFTYFGYVIQGVVIIIYDYIYGSKKAAYYAKVNCFRGNTDYVSYHKRNKNKTQS